jgi:hypothetical protein
MAAQLSANPRAIQWQSAWRVYRFSARLHLASPPLQSTISVFRTRRALAASILLHEQILLRYKRQWWVERGRKRAKANAELGPTGDRRGHRPEGAPRRARRRSRRDR